MLNGSERSSKASGMETQQAEVAEPETLDQRPEYYRVLKGGWFKGAGYKGS